MFLVWHYYKLSCYKHSCTGFCVSVVLIWQGKMSRNAKAELYVVALWRIFGFLLCFLRNYEAFSRMSTYFTFPTAMYGCSVSPHPHQHWVLSLFLFSYSESFRWYFLKLIMLKIFPFAYMSSIFFSTMCLQVSCPCSNWIVSIFSTLYLNFHNRVFLKGVFYELGDSNLSLFI